MCIVYGCHDNHNNSDFNCIMHYILELTYPTLDINAHTFRKSYCTTVTIVAVLKWQHLKTVKRTASVVLELKESEKRLMHIHIIFSIRTEATCVLWLSSTLVSKVALYCTSTPHCALCEPAAAQWLHLMAVDLESGRQGHTNKWHFCALETVSRGGQLTDFTLSHTQ